MMNIEQRLKITIGDLVLQIQAAHLRIEELEQALAQKDKPDEPKESVEPSAG